MSDPKTALDTLAREELGLDPDALGSPVRVAMSSFVSFTIGASVVVIPYLFFMAPGASTTIPASISIVLAVVAMLLVGGTVGRLSGRSVVFCALRQFLWGAGAALVTFGVGRLIGVSTG